MTGSQAGTDHQVSFLNVLKRLFWYDVVIRKCKCIALSEFSVYLVSGNNVTALIALAALQNNQMIKWVKPMPYQLPHFFFGELYNGTLKQTFWVNFLTLKIREVWFEL